MHPPSQDDAVTTFRQLLDAFDRAAKTRVAKGRRFEEFCEAFFQKDPLWVEQFDAVWAWMDWPGRQGRADSGIDLVAQERGTGHLVAIQCKFYSPDATLSWTQVSTFVALASRDEFRYGIIVSTAGAESANLTANLEQHHKPIRLWRVQDFEESAVDWDQFNIERPTQLNVFDAKELRDHQKAAIEDVVAGLADHDRGQLVMACGTGKTFTSLRLSERTVGAGGTVLFLVPSINLLSQSVKAWAADAEVPLATFAVCSDVRAGQRTKNEDLSPNDLSFPASTNAPALMEAVAARRSTSHMTVVFSTYQSIDVVSECQKAGLGDFDLIICDEAHRTTGAFKDDGDQSPFTKVHDETYVAGTTRLYMTATPRIYGDQAKASAARADVLVASMDDVTTFGPVFHELRFGAAVAGGLLTDYKVLVLAVDEGAVSAAFQKQLSRDGELALDDYAKIVGCWHGLSKRGPQFVEDNEPMQRAVAFSSTIVQSKRFASAFPQVVNQVLADRADSNAVKIETDHVDGTTNVKVRSEAIGWLEEPPGQRVCRVLSNAKCLTEGVDVPALDSVIFLNPRKSIVDVVQAVGRVMRLAPGKDFGYVILPIGVPSGMPPEEALRDNKRYQVVWQVLQALRSHDERLAAEINKIDINKSSSRVSVIGIGMGGGSDTEQPGRTTTQQSAAPGQLDIPDVSAWRNAMYAKIVEKVGDRRYMEHWAADISAIAVAQETRIRTLLDRPDINPEAASRFDEFLTALKHNLNDSIARDDAISMLSQHLITRPVFEALFGTGDFTHRNPVSAVMQSMIETFDASNLGTETATLEGFYEHVRMLIGGIDTAEGRQRIITELYEKFFKKALPKTAEALGIVYTPIEVVDEGVHVLDPFTGTGTFITRLMQSGLIASSALERKYRSELHANEYMLLAYYIAAINIETTYKAISRTDEYEPFDGIVLTDTFQMAERDDTFDTLLFPTNNARADHQKGLDIRVIIGNPPYSVGQTSQNDNNANLKYPDLDLSIGATYAARTSAQMKAGLYNSYIRAFRWASNRIQSSEDGGIVGFVTNGGWIDDKSADGIRLSLADEFHHLYIFNLRGNTRTSGEAARREGGQVFGPGSRNTVAISLLVKGPGSVPAKSARIHYRDIGDYLDRDAKLEIVKTSRVTGPDWSMITPNQHGDWVRLRDERYDRLLPLGGAPGALFIVGTSGVKTNRDPWVYNASQVALRSNLARMIEFYNGQLDDFHEGHRGPAKPTSDDVKAYVDRDPTKYSWDRADYSRIANGRRYVLREDMLRTSLYRPFNKRHLAFDRTLNNETYQVPKIFPEPSTDNVGFGVVAPGNEVPFSCVATDCLPQYALIGASSACAYFARWRFAPGPEQRFSNQLFADGPSERMSNLDSAAVSGMRSRYGDDVDDDAVFFYVYGILHSPDFRAAFATNLKKEAPRVPVVADSALFEAFSSAGRALLNLHVNYETVEPYPLEERWAAGAKPESDTKVLRVDKRMKHPKFSNPDSNEMVEDLSQLVYNEYLTIAGIPIEAHRYEVGTRSAIGWLIDRYYVSTDKQSGIANDPNDWGSEDGDPRYVIDLVKRVVTVSLRTVEIVEALPALHFDEDGIARAVAGIAKPT
jgi:predicted helicase